LNSAYGIVRDPNSGILYIADTASNRVMYYRSGSMSGMLVAGTGISGPNNTQLSVPYDIYYDLPTNSLLIANSGMNNIVRWVIGASSWTLIAGNSNGLAGSSSAQLSTPIGITSDPMGNVYVADTGNNRVQFFEAGQSNGVTIAGVNKTSGVNASLFSSPFYVALDSQLNLYVSDAYNHRIQKFQRY
jgi:DNA-binding beta-propeller fold protein YncE